jgi:proline racemase
MPEFNARLSNFATGNYLRLRWSVTGVPSGSAISSVTFKVKTTETDPDSALIISKTITTVNISGTGQIENTGATSGTGLVRVDLTSADTLLLTSGIRFVYWVDVSLSTGEISTLEAGVIFAQQGASHA